MTKGIRLRASLGPASRCFIQSGKSHLPDSTEARLPGSVRPKARSAHELAELFRYRKLEDKGISSISRRRGLRASRLGVYSFRFRLRLLGKPLSDEDCAVE